LNEENRTKSKKIIADTASMNLSANMTLIESGWSESMETKTKISAQAVQRFNLPADPTFKLIV